MGPSPEGLEGELKQSSHYVGGLEKDQDGDPRKTEKTPWKGEGNSIAERAANSKGEGQNLLSGTGVKTSRKSQKEYNNTTGSYVK